MWDITAWTGGNGGWLGRDGTGGPAATVFRIFLPCALLLIVNLRRYVTKARLAVGLASSAVPLLRILPSSSPAAAVAGVRSAQVLKGRAWFCSVLSEQSELAQGGWAGEGGIGRWNIQPVTVREVLRRVTVTRWISLSLSWQTLGLTQSSVVAAEKKKKLQISLQPDPRSNSPLFPI